MSGALRGVLLGGLLFLGGLMPGTAGAAGAKTRFTGQVNLNEATVSQLDLLPGVGTKAAQRIVAQRDKRAFKRVEELVRVKGFGKKRFVQLKPYLTLQGPTTLQAERGPTGKVAAQAPGAHP